MNKTVLRIVIVVFSILLLASSGYLTYYLLNRNHQPVVVEPYTEDEKTEIYQLMIRGDLEGYQKYLSDGRKLSFAFEDKTTPLELLIEQNDLLSAKTLMENGFDLTLVNNNHIDTVTAVLAHNELVNFEAFDQIAVQLVKQIKDEIENEDTNGYSLLISAIETNNQVLVEEVLKYITDIDRIYNGESALTFACLSGETNLDIVKMLIEQGADVNLTVSDGNNCLTKAVIYEQLDLIPYLLTETNINVNFKNSDGKTALHLAVLYANFNAIDQLLELSNIDKLIVDHDGKTAKAYAVELAKRFPMYEQYVNKL